MLHGKTATQIKKLSLGSTSNWTNERRFSSGHANGTCRGSHTDLKVSNDASRPRPLRCCLSDRVMTLGIRCRHAPETSQRRSAGRGGIVHSLHAEHQDRAVSSLRGRIFFYQIPAEADGKRRRSRCQWKMPQFPIESIFDTQPLVPSPRWLPSACSQMFEKKIRALFEGVSYSGYIRSNGTANVSVVLSAEKLSRPNILRLRLFHGDPGIDVGP